MKKEYELIDSHKLMYHPEWVRRWHAAQGTWELARTIYPLYVEVSPVGYCNHSCAWCGVDYVIEQAAGDDLAKNRWLDPVMIAETFRQMALRRGRGEEWNGVKSVMFAGEGEPTLHPKLADMVIAAHAVGIDVAVTTNATGLTSRFVDRVADRITWIKVSLDAATPATHAINHHASREQFAQIVRDPSVAGTIAGELLQKYPREFDRIIENIRYAAQAKRSGLECMVGAQMLMNPTNIHEVAAFVELMKELGCDYVVIKPYSQHRYSINKQEELFGGFTYRDALALNQRLQSFADETFHVAFRARTMENYEDPDRHYTVCQTTPMAWGYVMATGDFVSCSAYLPPGIGLGDQRFVLGNIKHQTFQDIWEGKKRRQNWQFVNSELDILECRKNCRMDAANRFLWDVRALPAGELEQHLAHDAPPKGVNFI